MAAIVVLSDLPAALQSAEMIDVMVAGANARASRVAPCLAATDPAPTEDRLSEAKLVLIGAVKRWSEAGSGALQQQNAGPFGMTVDTRQRTGFNLWPSEIEALQEICQGVSSVGAAFEVDTLPTTTSTTYLGVTSTSDLTGTTYYTSDLGYLDTEGV